MKHKFTAIIILALLSALCLGVTACSDGNVVDDYVAKGYNVVVTYDPSGAKFIGKEGNMLVDAYNVSAYDETNGTIEIKLVEPTERSIINQRVSLVKTGSFVVGWYRTRETVKNADGKVVDEDGNVLTERNGAYYNEQDVEVIPAYKYSNLWNFDTDTVKYTKGSGLYEMTLYAGWVDYYEFDYYAKNEKGEWEKYDSSAFDYKAAITSGSDKNAIFLPEYENGAMNYTHKYSSGEEYVFPKISDTTFVNAYLDEDMTMPVSSTYVHTGTLDLDTCTPQGRVVNIYVDVIEGERYRISSAEQITSHVNPRGYYELLNDVDFQGKSWPVLFSNSTFYGKFYSSEGNEFAISNVSAKYNSSSSEANYGGLFGAIDSSAVVENVVFDNVTVDIVSTAARLRYASFALFAGNIADDATVSATLRGELKLRINGQIAVDGQTCSINLVAGGNREGVTAQSATALEFYGRKVGSTYRFNFDPENVDIDENGNVFLTFGAYTKSEEVYTANVRL